MLVSEGQKLGALAVLMLSLFYCGFSLFHARQPGTGTPLRQDVPFTHPLGTPRVGKYGDRGPGRSSGGDLFLPKGTAFDHIFKVAGMPEGHSRLRSPERGISDGALLVISPQEK